MTICTKLFELIIHRDFGSLILLSIIFGGGGDSDIQENAKATFFSPFSS